MAADLRSALAAATVELTDAGVDSPRNDAEILAAHVLGCRRGALVVADMTGEQAGRYAELVSQRASRVPLQHLTGVAGFRHLDLAVGPGVFVPRPETELLAGWGLSVLGAAPVVVDLCAGSGALALSVANECPSARVYAVERTEFAVAWAGRNAETRAALGDTPITLLRGDATDPEVLRELDGTVDLVLTNPPYVPDGATVAREVAEHDPPEALWGGPDGLDVVRALVRRAAALLRPGGYLGIEHADSQGTAVPAVVRAAGGWTEVTDHRDLADRDRFTTARRDTMTP
ncbi:MAG: release factor glutamine methyltransferase [Actinomycetota bacterium]|nr:protein-(glutamine-N5) methyltransferase, release factor-specific [Cryptosporangiaceae bacterium]MDQ1678922.1 release factor glutamine methyltransferase [Actinomycetota bacterium]